MRAARRRVAAAGGEPLGYDAEGARAIPESAVAGLRRTLDDIVLYFAVRNLGELRSPQRRDPQLRMEAGTAGIHDLLRRTNPYSMTDAMITYTDDRTLPVSRVIPKHMDEAGVPLRGWGPVHHVTACSTEWGHPNRGLELSWLDRG